MPNLTCDIATLAQSRPSTLTDCLSRISTVSPYVSHKSGPFEFVLVARYGAQLTDVVREWSFPSTVESIRCRYIERWLPVDNAHQIWNLRHAYLHLDRHLGRNELPQEIFAFHWEPTRNRSLDEEGEYEQQPHAHFAFAPYPLLRSHFGVTLTVAPNEQANIAYLDRLLDEVINMVRIEVLNRILSSPNGWQ